MTTQDVFRFASLRATPSSSFRSVLVVLMLLGAAIVLLLAHAARAMDKSKFENCDQKGFCKRLRGMSKKSKYLITEPKVVNGVYSAVLQSKEEGSNFDPLLLVIEAYENGIFRIKIQEKVEPGTELQNRYNVKDVIVGSASKIALSDRSTTITLTNGNSQLLLENRDDGMKITFKVNGEDVIIFNDNNMLTVENVLREKNESYDGESAIGMDFTHVGSNHLYGLPERAMRLALNPTREGDNSLTEPYRLYNLDIFEYELNNPIGLYGAIPLLYSLTEKAAAGVFVLNPSETFVDIYKGAQYSSHWISETGVLDVFFLPGPTPKDISKQFSYLTGTAPLPQRFSLGHHQCRWNYKDEEDVRNVNAKFDEYDIPYDVLWLDIEHTDGKKYFTWDSHTFPNPKQMQDDLASKGRKMVTISDPHIKREHGYFVHDEATRNGYYVKNSEGTGDYEGHCWPGSSSWLDFVNPTVRDYYASLFSFDKYEGSTENLYTWIDMNEPSVFSGPEITMDKNALHYQNLRHREIHNMYGFYHGVATNDGHMKRRAGSDRPFILTRSLFAGSQRYVAKWTGDNMAEWTHLDIAQPMILALSISGMPFVGADVGGFFGNPEEELLVRWYQAGAFYPFFRAHAHIETKRREPWLFGDYNTQLIRKAIARRYSLLPFYYTLAFESMLSGLPYVRPLFMEYPNDVTTHSIDDAFLVGSDLLVKPVVTKATSDVAVYLPKGLWYDYETGEKFDAGRGKLISVSTSLEKSIPVFQRGGSIIPTQQRLRRSSQQMANDPFTLKIALNRKGEALGTLYLDDGSSFKYKTGDYLYRQFSFSNNELKSMEGDLSNLIYNQKANPISSAGSRKVSNVIERIIIYGASKPSSISIIYPSTLEQPTDLMTSPQFTYTDGVLTIKKPQIPLNADFTLKLNE
ncbi:hypothetical protein FDP41_012335 [Naegleria fowleri]|uniref:Glucosidase II subunit alpha n=1 Tax=Naegleria fowleri TaxID=5763 RepID=A0A6A5C7F5_NAEFO|nr:uncharacterized protein FDP41_012335 [Naegleria fowleri]KAF0981678.1 hypothetical protein FDP41_012335 [Naegleria fowleri]